MKVAFVGLGAMGAPMATHLLRAGHEVVGFNRSEPAMAAFRAAGGRVAPSAAAAAEGADAVVVMVVSADQVDDVLFGAGALEASRPGALALVASTLAPSDAERIGARVAATGRLYLDAPVSGGASGAEAGTLVFMASGADSAFAAAEPLLRAMGRTTHRLGDAPGAGSRMKMLNQLAAGCHLAVAAEALSFGARLGLEPAQVLEALLSAAGASWMMSDRRARFLDDAPPPRSTIDIFVKDLGIVLDEAARAGATLPVSEAARDVFAGASAAGFGQADDSQATRFYELKFASEPAPSGD